MTKKERFWHPNFLKYMDFIIHHPNYSGLKIDKKIDGTYSWIAPAKSETGQQRIVWCKQKALELGIPIQPGFYADVMLAIHPTKWKICQTCGKKMSLYYHYPNTTFLKALNGQFGFSFTVCDHISDIYNTLINNGINEDELKKFLIDKGNLSINPSTTSKEKLISALEIACRKGGKKCLGPGAMSNFPDRFDGFHTYNRCCRASQDKGRSKENLKTYVKDRRAYEYWSDGNIHAANQFMGSSFFEHTSADHIGPISLGFIHDPHYLQPMSSSDNSSKRDRLQINDIKKLISIENHTGVCSMSWYSKKIWEFIKANYSKNPNKISKEYRDALKQNMSNYMYILGFILKECNGKGAFFLETAFLEPKFKYFKYSYTCNENGEIINSSKRHFTDRNRDDVCRYVRIAFEAVADYNYKENRQRSQLLTEYELNILISICRDINSSCNITYIKAKLESLLDCIQTRIIRSL